MTSLKALNFPSSISSLYLLVFLLFLFILFGIDKEQKKMPFSLQQLSIKKKNMKEKLRQQEIEAAKGWRKYHSIFFKYSYSLSSFVKIRGCQKNFSVEIVIQWSFSMAFNCTNKDIFFYDLKTSILNFIFKSWIHQKKHYFLKNHKFNPWFLAPPFNTKNTTSKLSST